uniref:Peptidase S1 domain-containing protein n=1 Tax=Strongyloides stercoralis TaxID=6248 RepID=A0A0K0E4D2_STRER
MKSFLLITVILILKITLILSKKECGIVFNDKRNNDILNKRSISKIVGGDISSNNSWPWIVQIAIKKNNQVVCGGALISDDLVLTVAHCFRDGKTNKSEHLRVYYGSNVMFEKEYVDVEDISKHPSFFFEYDRAGYDISLLKLKEKVKFDFTTFPLCLPDEDVKVSDICFAAGFGYDKENGYQSEYLKEILVPVMPMSLCNDEDHYGGIVDEKSNFCGGYSSGIKDICQGDSGGPLMCLNDDIWKAQGIASWGHGCGRLYRPGVYSNVNKLKPWIVSQLKKYKKNITDFYENE